MKLITVAGPPSSGKTSIIIKTLEWLKKKGYNAGVVKFDCISSNDVEAYNQKGILSLVGLSGGICPDHFFVTNIEQCVEWGFENDLDILISESAGLCNRCSPYIKEILSICVIDNLSGINTPTKIGPMLKFADIIVITKGDIVSQAEREVFCFKVRQVNSSAKILQINGITGQGSNQLCKLFENAEDIDTLNGMLLRFTMPSALCSYCLGERTIGVDFQMGNTKMMDFQRG